jgi:hypothetical protein
MRMRRGFTRRPQNTARRSRARWLIAAGLGVALLPFALPASPAAGAVTLGQLGPTSLSADCPATPADYLQPSVTGGNLYIARQAGTITSWSTRSAGAGATYVFKAFRRTSDPDVFRVIAHASAHPLTAGVNTVPVSVAVRSGDMIGLNAGGAPSSCTFSQPGDGILTRGGSLSDDASGQFAPLNDVRLNLTATLIPTNVFTIGAITRDRKHGTATVLIDVPNPGVLTIAGKGLKKRPAKNVAVAGTAQFQIAAVGARRRTLEKKGKVVMVPSIGFTPTSGDPALQSFVVKLKKRRSQPMVLASHDAH